MLSETVERRDRHWQFILLLLCAVSFLITLSSAADGLGFAGRPWFGWWDANAAASGQPYVVAVEQPRPGGASASGGLRDHDRIDLREQNLGARFAVVYQPMATQTMLLTVHRGSSTLAIRVAPSTAWEGAPLWKLPSIVSRPIASLWFVACAMLIAMRRWWNRDARILALVLLAIPGTLLDPSSFVVPSGALTAVSLLIARACAAIASLLLVKLSSDFGARSRFRTSLERVAYAVILFGFLADVAAAAALVMLRFDPLPFIFRISTLRGAIDIAGLLLVVLCAITGVLNTAESARPRTAWLLLPLPVALLTSAAVATLVIFVASWFANVVVIFSSDAIVLLGAFIVTYALLKRRVLDSEFVLSRTLVVGTVSLIVVASFVLLEWLLGTVLSGASHATGLIANGALALTLGLSLNVIHRRVDTLVDAVLFRKRRADERMLLEFSKEAAYVTEPNALLDQAIAKIEQHTDARSGALLLAESTLYTAARTFGNASLQASENDSAILALKTWHKPIDPHHYRTVLHGALALPMLARGHLLGVLLLGERAGGEAYAPDEVEALSQFAHGVGSALDALSIKNDGLIVTLQQSMAAMADAIAVLGKETASLRTEIMMRSLDDLRPTSGGG